VASTTLSPTRDIVQEIATEMAAGVERAVDCWMAQVEHALADTRLTSLGRLYAVRDIVERYKTLSGKQRLDGRDS